MAREEREEDWEWEVDEGEWRGRAGGKYLLSAYFAAPQALRPHTTTSFPTPPNYTLGASQCAIARVHKQMEEEEEEERDRTSRWEEGPPFTSRDIVARM